MSLTKRIYGLLSVKSIVTLVLTGVFAYLAVAGSVSEQFMTIYVTVSAFYFGTQAQKGSDTAVKENGNDGK